MILPCSVVAVRNDRGEPETLFDQKDNETSLSRTARWCDRFDNEHKALGRFDQNSLVVPHIPLTMLSVTFLASPSNIMVLSR
jgi:hypothetical protein